MPSFTSSSSPFILGSILGNGGFSTVHVGIFAPSSRGEDDQSLGKRGNKEQTALSKTKKRYAVKCIDKKRPGNDTSNIQNEINVLSKCVGVQFVAQMHFTYESLTTFYICLDYCQGGDLHTIQTTRGIHYDQSLFYLAQIARGLAQLHEREIIYHDLKPQNVCVDSQGNVKLVDFGLATILDDSMYNPETGRNEVVSSSGTLQYSAPEVFLRQSHAFEVDWWSYGVIAYELLSGELPFYLENASMEEQCEYICEKSTQFHRNQFIVKDSVEESFLQLFLQQDPRKRFGYGDFIDMSLLECHEIFTTSDIQRVCETL